MPDWRGGRDRMRPRPYDQDILLASKLVKSLAAAIQAAEDVKKLIRQQNSLGVRMLTNGLLNGFDVDVDGSIVRGRLPASKEQLETLLGLVASQLGVTLPETTTPQH